MDHAYVANQLVVQVLYGMYAVGDSGQIYMNYA